VGRARNHSAKSPITLTPQFYKLQDALAEKLCCLGLANRILNSNRKDFLISPLRQDSFCIREQPWQCCRLQIDQKGFCVNGVVEDANACRVPSTTGSTWYWRIAKWSTTVRVNTDKNVGHITVVDYYYHVARDPKDKITTTGARMRIVEFPTAHCMFRMDITVHSYRFVSVAIRNFYVNALGSVTYCYLTL
jgi:hypothetical protein